jgi:hypothetical protein
LEVSSSWDHALQFDDHPQLFTADPKKSWVEFRATKGLQIYNQRNLSEDEKTWEKCSIGQSWDTSVKITEEKQIWETSRLKVWHKSYLSRRY